MILSIIIIGFIILIIQSYRFKRDTAEIVSKKKKERIVPKIPNLDRYLYWREAINRHPTIKWIDWYNISESKGYGDNFDYIFIGNIDEILLNKLNISNNQIDIWKVTLKDEDTLSIVAVLNSDRSICKVILTSKDYQEEIDFEVWAELDIFYERTNDLLTDYFNNYPNK